MAGLIAGWRKRLTSAEAEATPEATGAEVKEADGYIYYSGEEELDENRQKQQAHRQRGEVVPIALTIELERLIEAKRIGNDQNFREGRI